MIKWTMQQDFSWSRAAGAYEAAYLDAYARRRGHAFAALIFGSFSPLSAPGLRAAVERGVASPTGDALLRARTRLVFW